MRLLIRVGLVEEKRPVELQAAADEQSGPVGRWFSANLSIGTVLAVLTACVTLIGSYYTLESGQARQDAQIAANAAAIRALSDKFDAQVIPRNEYQNHMRDITAAINALQTQQQQIYTVMLNRALAAPAR